MRIEVLCTGDELLTGLIADTNSAFFLERLFGQLGLQCQRVQVVGDVRADLIAAIREASARSDAVLVSGGLGPTADDLTAECAAAAQGVPLVEDQAVREEIRRRFEKRGMTFTPNNAKQALVPQGAEVVPNPVGSAPMFVQRLGGCTLFYLPGVPREYRYLVEHQVLPRLRAMLQARPDRTYAASRLLKTIGLPESHLDALVAPIAQAHQKVTFGFRTAPPENHLKLSARAPTQAEADAALAAVEAQCREALARWLFGQDEETLSGCVGKLLRARGETVVIAESCTGGLTAQLFTDTPGASDYFRGAAVTYQDALKLLWANVAPATLERHGAVSAEVAREMARGVRARADATYALAITGYAGPGGGTAADPVGTVYLALAYPSGEDCERHLFGGDRERIRLFAAAYALDLLRRRLLGIA